MKIIHQRSFTTKYGRNAGLHVSSYLVNKEKIKRVGKGKYEIPDDFVFEQKYLAEVMENSKISISDAVSDAESEIQELASELRDWEGSLPDNLRDSEKGQAVSQAADTLESITIPEVDEKFDALGKQPFLSDLESNSRSDRCSEVVQKLQVACSILQDAPYEEDSEDFNEAQELVANIEEIISELENVEFPGMYS